MSDSVPEAMMGVPAFCVVASENSSQLSTLVKLRKESKGIKEIR